MSSRSYTTRALALSVEAREQSTIEMWHKRNKMPLLPRIGKTALGAIFRNEKIREALALRVARSIGGQAVLGHGCEQLVIPAGNDVRKLIFTSFSQDHAAVEARAEELQQQSDICGSYLGEFWLPTNFEAVRTRRTGKSVVVATQPRIHNPTQYLTAFDVPPSGQTKELVGIINTLHEDQQLYPDLIGLNNIVLPEGSKDIRLVDTVAVTPELQAKVLMGQDGTIAELIEDRLLAWQG